MPKTPCTGYTNLQTGGEGVYHGFNPQDLYTLLRAMDKKVLHPFIKKAVKGISVRGCASGTTNLAWTLFKATAIPLVVDAWRSLLVDKFMNVGYIN